MIKLSHTILLITLCASPITYAQQLQNSIPDKEVVEPANGSTQTYYGPKKFTREKWGEQTVVCNGPTTIKKSHSKNIVIHGPSTFKRVTASNTILVHGPSRMSQLKAGGITIHGPLRMNEVTVQEEIAAHGPARMKSVKAKKVTILGPTTISQSTIDTLSIVIKDGTNSNQYLDLKDVTINESLDVIVSKKDVKVYFENVIANKVTISLERPGCRIYLKGNTNFSGAIKFPQGKGRVYVTDNASFKGSIDGGKLIEEK